MVSLKLSFYFLLLTISTQVSSQCIKPSISLSNNNKQIAANNTQSLYQALAKANQQNNTIIYLEEGLYQLSKPLIITGNHIAIIGKAGNREKVHLKGQGMKGILTHIFHISANNTTIANLKLGEISQHGIQVHGENGTNNTLLHNLHVYNTGEQMIKVSSAHKPDKRAVNGVIQWSRFEFTNGIANQYYTGGVDAHNAKNWIIRHNTFSGIKSPDHRLAEHAIHFWSGSENTLVENNRIYNSDRGIGFGFPPIGTKKNGGHIGGIIRNNMIHTNRDVGIALERSNNTAVYNNSLYTENYFNSVEYRFSETQDVLITNNLSNKKIKQRDNASALILTNNIENSHKSWFVNVKTADLHLTTGFPHIINKANGIESFYQDFDCSNRIKNNASDIGADEYQGKINHEIKISQHSMIENVNEYTKTLIQKITNQLKKIKADF